MTSLPPSQQSDEDAVPDLMQALLDSLHDARRHDPGCVYADGEDCDCGADAKTGTQPLDAADVDGPICHRATCVAEGDCGCADGGSVVAAQSRSGSLPEGEK